MITALVLLPIIGSLVLIFIDTTQPKMLALAKQIALSSSLLVFALSIFIWVGFDSSYDGYQFVESYSTKDVTQFHFYLGVDGLNLFFVLLTTFITPIALLSNYTTITNRVKTFLICFLLLESLQLLAFVSLDLFMFYVFFESILPILFIVIIVYGTGEERVRSAYLLFLYTLLGSLFMLLAIITIYNYASTTDIMTLSLREITLENQKILWLAFFLAFAVKTPLWPLASWLYRAHADSPLAGSILLAGTVLKLATYGFLRISISILPDACAYYGPLVQTIAVVSLIYASLSTVIQEDTKVLVAYSSIAHMAVVVLGLFSNTVVGIEGAILLSIAHSCTSGGLFYIVGGVIYDRLHTRKIKLISGLVTYMPVMVIFFLLFTLANTGIPLSLNFLGEQLALIGTWQSNPVIASIGASGIVLSACYSVNFFNKLAYGSFTVHMRKIFLLDADLRDVAVLTTLLIPTVVIGVMANVVLDSLHVAVTQLIYVA